MKDEKRSREKELFLEVSYLITLSLWMWNFWSDVKGFDDFIVLIGLSVILSGLTFWLVAIWLVILWIPVEILLEIVKYLQGKR